MGIIKKLAINTHNAVQMPAEERRIIDEVAYTLLAQGLAIIPTDTVYGIACAAVPNNAAHKRIFELKDRPLTQTLPWLIADFDELERYAKDISEDALVLATQLWPGALTLIVHASDEVPVEYQAADKTLALRLPQHELSRQLIRACATPLITTSDNVHGKPAACSIDELDCKLTDLVDITLDVGYTHAAQASTIVDCAHGKVKIIRQGAIEKHRIAELVELAEAL